LHIDAFFSKHCLWVDFPCSWLGFLRAGIPLSVVFTFLIASPMINEIAVIILIGVVGWKLGQISHCTHTLSELVVRYK
jgi:uncharacterized membrane protein YraQ (UPF0718 family)